MFSPTIQGYIDDGGKEAAMKRLAQINARVDSINKQINPEQAKTKEASFSDILKSSKMNVFRVNNSKKPQAVAETADLKTYSVTNPSRVQIKDMISKVCQKYGVDEKLVNAVIRQESGFNPKAVSHCGASGLMQLMPATAKGLGVKDPFNALQNVDGGVRHLKGLLARYNGNVILALAAYNAGGGNVDKYGGVPPFKETQNYVKNILANYLG